MINKKGITTKPVWRTCIVCGLKHDKKSLFRFTRYPFCLDPLYRSAGRGYYVCGNISCLDKDRLRKAIYKAFRSRDIKITDVDSLLKDINFYIG